MPVSVFTIRTFLQSSFGFELTTKERSEHQFSSGSASSAVHCGFSGQLNETHKVLAEVLISVLER